MSYSEDRDRAPQDARGDAARHEVPAAPGEGEGGQRPANEVPPAPFDRSADTTAGDESSAHHAGATDPAAKPTPTRRVVGVAVLTSAIVAALVASLVVVPALLTADDEPAEVVDEPADPDADPPSVDLSALEDVESPVEAIAEATLPSVARVDVPGGAGSAVVYDSDGLLVTNNHVVAGADEVRIVLANGERLPAEVIGRADFADLAVLRADVDGLPPAEFADELPRVGELTVAIGSPFGLDATVTSGVVSALERSIVAGMGPDAQPLGDLIQTDAAINPGNSGGPLVNSAGEVIGINTAIASGTGANQGVGFAIPTINAVPIAERLIEEGTIAPAFLGIEGEDLDPQDAEMFDIGVARGAIIRSVVPDTPADEAGLVEGDVVVAVDDRPIDSMVALAARIRIFEPGTEVELEYVRDGETLTTALELVETPEDMPTSG